MTGSRKRKYAHEVSNYAMPYIEFHSQLLKLLDLCNKTQSSTKRAFTLLATCPQIFTAATGGIPVVTVNWPYADEQREIEIEVSDQNELAFTFNYKDMQFLKISHVQNSDIKVERFNHKKNTDWSSADIDELVDTFNMVLRAKKITYVATNNQADAIIEFNKNTTNRYNKTEFDGFIAECAAYNLTYRVNNVIVKNANRRGLNYTFHLDWPDALQQLHQLKVTFSRADSFHEDYSWFVDEAVLLENFPEYKRDGLVPGQVYYSLTVDEVVSAEDEVTSEEVEILSFWLTVDGLFGELRDLKKGIQLSGNDVLSIYNYFEQIFRVKNTFICDESKLQNADDSVRIPLRLITALCNSQTWYQSKLSGVTLFECNNFATSKDGMLTQNPMIRANALRELQNCRVTDWCAMLNANDKKRLESLFDDTKNTAITRSPHRSRAGNAQTNPKFGTTTIQELTIKIYNDAKAARTITQPLEILVDLLCSNMHIPLEDGIKLDKTAADYWVKSRVHELIWGSYFWVKKIPDDSTTQLETKHYSNRR